MHFSLGKCVCIPNSQLMGKQRIFLLSAFIKLDLSEGLTGFYFHGNFANTHPGACRRDYKLKMKRNGRTNTSFLSFKKLVEF